MSNDEKKFDEWRKEQAKKRITKPGNGHPRLSKAPPPITPAAGFKAYGVTTRIAPPANTLDWREWINTPKVEVWQACALSLNIDPHSLKQRDGYMSESGGSPYFKDYSFPSIAIREECNLRRRVLIANLRDDPKKFSLRSSTASGYSEVRLSEFAAWALSIGWDIPAELAAMAKMPAVDANTHETAAQPMKATAPTGTKPALAMASTNRRKRCALKKELHQRWPTIENDLRHADENGLKKAAKLPKHGFWDLDAAIGWAQEYGKIRASKIQPEHSPLTEWSLNRKQK